MYQGKFDAKKKGQTSSEETLKQILAERNAPKSAKAPKVTSKAAPASAAKPAAAKKSPAVKQAPAAPAKKEKKSGKTFYKIYFSLIAVFLLLTAGMLVWLQRWLTNYEAAQPTLKCQEVFEELFGNPDWSALYQMSGLEGTAYEGEEQYVAYMSEKVGSQELNFVETSAGLSGDKKYIVRLDKEAIATFTLEGKSRFITDIPDWKLGKVELIFSRQQGYLIRKMDGHTAYVNGVPLDDSFTIQIASTQAEKYLPIGTSGVRTCLQSITGLMAQPTVTVFGPTGDEHEVIYDEATGTFIEQTEANAIPDEHRELTLNTLKSYGEFMIKASGGRAGVAKYFDGTSQIYKDISAMEKELWMNKDYGHRFSGEEVTDYCRYSDSLFSVRGKLVMNATLSDGSTKDFDIEQSLFFRQKTDGKWVCYEMTNEDVSLPVGQVRLTFINDSGVLDTGFYDTDATELITPVVSAPDGKVFAGWYKEEFDASGRRSLIPAFSADEAGHVTLAPGTHLEPMTLYALFVNAEQGGNQE